jgi:hypothetical protein
MDWLNKIMMEADRYIAKQDPVLREALLNEARDKMLPDSNRSVKSSSSNK